MAIEFLNHINLNDSQLQNAKLHVTSSAPTAAAGQIYVDSGDSNKLKYHNGTEFLTLGTATGDITDVALTTDDSTTTTDSTGSAAFTFAGGAGLITSASSSTLTWNLDIDGMTDIGAALVDADLLIVDDGANGTNRKATMSRLKTYMMGGTLTAAAQTNITSLGTLTALTVDDVAVNGKVITMTGSSSDTATFTAGTNGTLDIVTTDAGGAAANIQITADGTAELAGTTVTLDSSGGITLDADNGTITFADAGSSLGTITSSGYSGNAATVTNGVTLAGSQTLTNKVLTSPDINTPDIDGGTIDGATIATSDITVGSGKTLDVSGGTLTLANDQISGDKVSGGTIGTTTITALAGHLSMGDNNITNVGDINCDSISIDDQSAGLTIDFSGAATTKSIIAIADNLGEALVISQGTDDYLNIATANGSETIGLVGVEGTAITIGHTTSEVTIGDNLTVTGDLKVSGATTTVNTSTMTVKDPIISLGTADDGAAPGSDDNKDRGLAMHWHNGSAAKIAFLGFDDSAGDLTFIPDASISSEVVSGTQGTINANLSGEVTGNASTATALATTRAFQTNLASTSSANFDGSAANTHGVTGTLAVGNGGTGVTSMTNLKNALDDETWSFANNTTLAGFVLDGNTITGVDDSGEFTDDDAHIMTSAGINDRFAQINADTTGTAGIATTVTVADESSDTTCFPLFATAATGDLGPKSGSNLTFNSSSGLLTATLLAGTLTGDVTGDVTGNADTATVLASGAVGGVKVVELTHGAGGVTNENSSNSTNSAVWTITHGMGNGRFYKVEVVKDSGNYDTVYTDVTRPSDTTVVITFGADVANGAYRAMLTRMA